MGSAAIGLCSAGRDQKTFSVNRSLSLCSTCRLGANFATGFLLGNYEGVPLALCTVFDSILWLSDRLRPETGEFSSTNKYPCLCCERFHRQTSPPNKRCAKHLC